MSTALNLASLAKMSSRWSISASVSGGALARRAPISVPESRSSRISPGVISTSEPSPSRVRTRLSNRHPPDEGTIS